MNRNKLFAGVIGLLFFATGLSAKDYQAVMFGIKSDGVTLNTRSIQRAVDYISEQGGGTVDLLCRSLPDWFGRVKIQRDDSCHRRGRSCGCSVSL